MMAKSRTVRHDLVRPLESGYTGDILLSCLYFGQVMKTGGQTESDAYEPTVHKHRCAKNALRAIAPYTLHSQNSM